MSGKYLLDTNVIIYALKDGKVFPSGNYAISIITEMELLSYSKLKESEKQTIQSLLNHFEIFNITKEIKEQTIHIRQNDGIKLPDSIICATALVNNRILISNDRQLFKIGNLKVIPLELLLGISDTL